MLSSDLKVIRLSGVADKLRELGQQAEQVAADVVNDTAKFAYDLGRESILDDVLFPSGYLDSGGRFAIGQKATTRKPEATIRARDRATSLARFVVGNPKPYARGGVRVRVKRKGTATTLNRAWVTGLNKNNRGLAIRVPKGGSIAGRKQGTRGLPVLRKDAHSSTYLLYGPSVNQVFKGNAKSLAPEISEYMAASFTRRYKRILNK
ncbi:MAG: hypothetical protein JKX92_06085 [Porticoccaceae bacterium]|nr:hypothetical protein [Porticoccaceae bacterium]